LTRTPGGGIREGGDACKFDVRDAGGKRNYKTKEREKRRD
jgi:hypothetical protein